MTHPDDLLADYVDGTLDREERVAVEAHLTTCAQCRHDVDLAAVAAGALGQLVDPAVPAGFAERVLAAIEAPQGETRPGGSAPAWYRWLGAAAAAAVVVALAFALPSIGGDDRGRDQLEGAPSAAALDEGDGIARLTGDLDEAGVQRLASGALEEAKDGGSPVASAYPNAEGDPTDVATSEDAFGAARRSAIDCLYDAAPNLARRGEPRQLYSATFRGAPAYLGLFLRSHGGSGSFDRAEVWVVDAGSCVILNLTQVAT